MGIRSLHSPSMAEIGAVTIFYYFYLLAVWDDVRTFLEILTKIDDFLFKRKYAI